jgi:hypothetical protein
MRLGYNNEFGSSSTRLARLFSISRIAFELLLPTINLLSPIRAADIFTCQLSLSLDYL